METRPLNYLGKEKPLTSSVGATRPASGYGASDESRVTMQHYRRWQKPGEDSVLPLQFLNHAPSLLEDPACMQQLQQQTQHAGDRRSLGYPRVQPAPPSVINLGPHRKDDVRP